MGWFRTLPPGGGYGARAGVVGLRLEGTALLTVK
jgi:hypothetical protein